MHIGVDFDNTIVCYDALFHRVAREKNLIPDTVPVNKSDVRNYLRRVGNEEAWTEMQGYVYGFRMAEAAPYPGVIEFFQACRKAGIPISIISHKTRHPFRGESYDLHAAATAWLEQQGFFDSAKIGLPRTEVFFELTKASKLKRIGSCGCTHFVDDLPEFLAEAAFPPGVLRILFDSNELYGAEARFLRASAWSVIRELFALELTCPADASALREKANPLVRLLGDTGAYVLQPLLGGANNRVFRLRSEAGDWVLKSYFQNPADLRNRFRAERAFYEHLWSAGVRRTPEPLGWDAGQRLGVFSHVSGRKLDPDEIGAAMVDQAADFILEINQTLPTDAAAMPIASEACFSMAEHLETVDRRVRRLQDLAPATDLDRGAADFVRAELNPTWERLRAKIVAEAGACLTDTLPLSARCLSPSDFGFHNALLAADGGLRFFDFEYAGWDDPAKLVCDFFCQPERPVSISHWEHWIGKLETKFDESPTLLARSKRLLPAYRVKWCCIILNEFLLSDRARREFSLGKIVATDRKRAQLDKAQAVLRLVS